MRWDVPDGWQQGKGAWGGLTISRVAQAVSDLEDPDRLIRTISVQIPEPVIVSAHEVVATRLRRGSAMSSWNVDVTRDTNAEEALTVAQAQVITGTGRSVSVQPPLSEWGIDVMPDVPAWNDTLVVPVAPPFGPVFTQHLEYRPITPLPTQGENAHTQGWVRIPSRTDPSDSWTAAELLGIVDAWWPASYAVMDSMHPMATVAFSAHLLVDPRELESVDGERLPLLHDATVSSAHEGFTSELRRLWTPDGRIVVENLQSIVVIK